MMIHPFDIEELACEILGLDYDEIDADTEIIEEKMHDEFFIDLDTFSNIVSKLIVLIDVGESPLTKEVFKGFAKDGMWLTKIKVK